MQRAPRDPRSGKENSASAPHSLSRSADPIPDEHQKRHRKKSPVQKDQKFLVWRKSLTMVYVGDLAKGFRPGPGYRGDLRAL